LSEKGPGLRETPNIVTPGTVRAHAHPRGNERSWETSCAKSSCQGCQGYSIHLPSKLPERKEATNRTNTDAGVSKVEKLIETGYEYGPEKPNRPRAKGVDGHLHVIRVGDGSPHFGIRRLVLPLWWMEEKVARRGEANKVREVS
jgi:hypothetical protein